MQQPQRAVDPDGAGGQCSSEGKENGGPAMPIHAYLKVKGSNQGEISTGCGVQEGHENEILVYSFDHTILLPCDRDTGQPSGRRQHTPFKICKKIDAATPLLYKALTKGEPV